MNYNIIILITILLVTILIIRAFKKKNIWKTPTLEFNSSWRVILFENISFYNVLNKEEKKQFEFKIQEFLLNCRITGIKTPVNDIDKILVASSAVIPIFRFPEWKYLNLKEVLLYPSSFDENFDTSKGNPILGMVGTGYMEGKMILSKPSLHHGFRNETDKKNTAIHEFVHLIDKADGTIDGIPELLLEKQYSIPWIDLIIKKIDEIYDGKSDINPYGATSKSEFFPVISEYFFERPELLERKHPELFKYLEKMFKTKLSLNAKERKKVKVGRNSLCPCGSEKKFKHCCLKN